MTPAQAAFFRRAIVVVILATLAVLTIDWRQCTELGGQYVRGLFWMECIK